MTTLSLHIKSASITDLWELDILGIQEPTEKKNKEEMAMAAKELFLQTLNVNSEGRYEVRLPWLDGHPPLPTNYNVAKKRLNSAVCKLKSDGILERYDKVFRDWESEGIIEKTDNFVVQGHYLPHRPVIKENSTTQIRPVFDGSAREKDKPSLNQCLEKGQNLIELIPSLLLRFRENQIGVISDIRKAFLQISIHEKDRDFLRFLRVDDQGKDIVFRHRRVVFGVNSSPFLLGATIEYHLTQCLEKCSTSGATYSRPTVEKLKKSFYVDNCVASVPDQETLNKFINESILIMAEGKFGLRGWEFSQKISSDNDYVSVLGLNWFPKRDVLTINQQFLKDDDDYTDATIVTKRRVLSMAQRVFDPIGFTCPTTLIPKLLLQRLWEKKLTWDSPIDNDIAKSFKHWVRDLPYLFKIEIPRWTSTGSSDVQNLSIQVFCDASKDAFGTAIFLRVVRNGKVLIHLLAARSRVAPLKRMTIPRLELLAATIGARLYAQVVQNLECHTECFFWSDSSTVISWIQRKEEWGTFVWNRVAEIRRLTPVEKWRHLPGTLNPADLPSRGCSPKQPLDLKWWEGPNWLYNDPKMWPSENPTVDENEIAKERKKKLVTTLVSLHSSDLWHLCYFSRYTKTVRMIAWIFRFIYNANVRNSNKKKNGDLSVDEHDAAERFIFKLVQLESFSDTNEKRISSLSPFYDEHGLIRLKSKVSSRKDTENYRLPLVLPSKHSVVNILIMDLHIKSCHVGTQGLLSLLREKYWILGGRRFVRSVISKCAICKRHDSKPFVVETPPLPLDRVRDAAVFEVTGLDFAGPLYLKDGEKAWVCLFTCAVYRAVHPELTMSMSTSGFLQTLRRFVARRGRPKTIQGEL